MNEIGQSAGAYPAALDGYVQQGQLFLSMAAQNLLQYGRVLTEAKPLVPRGQFESWVKENFRMSERSAQGYMAVWRRFGGQEQFQNVQFSNLQKMLALPAGAEESFCQTHDLEEMTAREVENAVKKVREEAAAAIAKERAARESAEAQAQQARQQVPEERDLAPELERKDAEIQRYKEQTQQLAEDLRLASEEKNKTASALQEARRDLTEAEELLSQSQQEYNRLQGELLNQRSAEAKTAGMRTIPEQLTCEEFSAAVRTFLGSAGQMPYMAETFINISDMREYRQWCAMVDAMEDWVGKARRALTTGGDIIG